MGRRRWVALAALGMTSSAAWAQHDFAMGLYLDGRYTDNATRVAEGSAQVEELQTGAGLSAEGELNGPWSRLDANLSLEHRRYSEQTYEDENRLLGGANLLLGKQDGLFELALGYASQEFVVNPTMGDTADNLDRRTTLSSRVTAAGDRKTGSGPSAWVEYAETQLQVNDFADSRRSGGGIAYRRAYPTSAWTVEYETYDLEYVVLDEEFTLSTLSAIYERSSRHWDMRLAVGANEAELENSSETEPYYELTLNYDAAVHQFDLSATSFISDTSQGGRAGVERTLLSEGLDGFVGEEVVDQFVTDRYSLGWSYAGLCTLCTLRTSISYSSEEYYNFTEYDADSLGVELGLSYLLNRDTSLFVSIGESDYDVGEGAVGRGSFSEQNARVGVEFSSIIRDGSLGLEVGYSDREFDDAEGYDTTYVRMNFRYELM